jgi:hypothetical protein
MYDNVLDYPGLCGVVCFNNHYDELEVVQWGTNESCLGPGAFQATRMRALVWSYSWNYSWNYQYLD